MSRPTLDEVRELDGQRVRLTVPKPRENQRLLGVVEADSERVVLRVEAGTDRMDESHTTVVLREREGDGVLRAYRGADGDLLVGRVKRVTLVDE